MGQSKGKIMLSSFHIVLARKPLEGTVSENCLLHSCGALNIDGCRVGTETIQINTLEKWSGFGQEKRPDYVPRQQIGRFPANLIIEDCANIVALFPETKSGDIKPYKHATKGNLDFRRGLDCATGSREGDSGSASRFFKQVKSC